MRNNSEQTIQIQATPGSLVIFRVSITSKIVAPAVIQPTLDNWIRKDGKAFLPEYNVEPAYSFLQTGREAKVNFTIQAPKEVNAGDLLYSVLVIPSAEKYNYPIILEILPVETSNRHAFDYSTSINVPPDTVSEMEANNEALISKSTVKLLGGLASLEVIPSKWVVSELILSCCSRGYKTALTEEGGARLQKIALTRFFKNGVLIFQGTQFVQWIKLALTISSGINSIAGGKEGGGMILQNWEEWLFNLLDQDIESPQFEYKKVELPTSVDNKSVLDAMGTDPEKWFGYFILGLQIISPRIEYVINQLIEDIESPKTKKKQNKQPKNVLNEKGSLQR